MNKLLFVKGAGMVIFDFCMFEMKSANEREVRQERKRTNIIQHLAGAAHGVDEVPEPWKTTTRHNAGLEGHDMPGVQRRVLQNRVRDHHEGQEHLRQLLGRSGQAPNGTH